MSTARRQLGSAGIALLVLSVVACSSAGGSGSGVVYDAKGDIITALAGQPTASVTALQAVLAAHKPGDQVQARLSRNGAEPTVLVTLGSLTS